MFTCIQCLTETYSELNHTPFHKHQDRTSFINCQRLLTQLVLFLLRTFNNPLFPLPLPEHITTLLTTLRNGFLQADRIIGQPEEVEELEVIQNVSKALHALLFALWTQPWVPSSYQVAGEEKENLIPDPTTQFLVCTQANQDGSIKDPHNVTGVIAKMVYCMVSLMLLVYKYVY